MSEPQRSDTPELVVVTGGGSGMGRAIALRQAHAGATVLIAGRREGPLAETATRSPDGRIQTVVADVSTPAGAERLAAAVDGRPITGVVTAAGGQGPFRTYEPDLASVERAWAEALRTNFTTTLLTVEALAPLVADTRGRVVLISSTSALDGRGGPYATAKAAVHGYGRDLAARLGRRGIAVNILAPGFVADTEFFDAGGIPVSRPMLDSAAAATLVGKTGTTTDVAAAAAWLLSDEGGFMSGQVVALNGGTTLVR
jgi:3-oxoacyl-[acyl-carrier protein] reductase